MSATPPLPGRGAGAGPAVGPAASGLSPFLPLLIFFAAWLGWAGFQAYQLRAESKTLTTLKANQEAPLQQAQQVRQRLDALASETQKLADAGNPNAKTVIQELRKRGITVKPPSAPPPAN